MHTCTHTTRTLLSPPMFLLCIDVCIQELALERLAVGGWGVWQFGQNSVSVSQATQTSSGSLSIGSRYLWLHHYYIMPNTHILSSYIWFDFFFTCTPNEFNFPSHYKCFCSYFNRLCILLPFIVKRKKAIHYLHLIFSIQKRRGGP